MPQRLVAAQGIGVMIRMALEMKQCQVAEDVIAVPGMLRLAAFVATIGFLAAKQAVVLDVIGGCQNLVRRQVVQKQVRQHEPDEPCNEHHGNCEAERI